MLKNTRKKSRAYQPQSTGRLCDFPGCKHEGIYKAPKDRRLKEYHWFCLEHVQEYNKNWNFYEGMGIDQMEEQLRLDSVGHRPTWQVNDLYANRLKDPLDILGLSKGRNRNRQKPKIDAFESKDAHFYPANLSTVEHLDAIRLLDLSIPITTEKVKTKYKSLAKKYHPDKNAGSKDAEEIFKNITGAYHLLIKALRE